MTMTHNPEIGAGFPEPTFGADFWTVCHRYYVSSVSCVTYVSYVPYVSSVTFLTLSALRWMETPLKAQLSIYSSKEYRHICFKKKIDA